MADPEKEVRPFIYMDASAYPLNNPSFKMKAGIPLYE